MIFHVVNISFFFFFPIQITVTDQNIEKKKIFLIKFDEVVYQLSINHSSITLPIIAKPKPTTALNRVN